VFDLVAVDRRYVNNDDFVSSVQVKKPYKANAADLEILKDAGHYRVLDITSGSTKASYFHNSVNGYHAAKMKRYNDVFDFYISRNHLEVINMLNTKYIIDRGEDGSPIAFNNPEANGNAWFVNELKVVEDADAAIRALDSIDTKNTAIQENSPKLSEQVGSALKVDSLASIDLIAYQPNYLKYQSSNTHDGFAVFSENYYPHGWHVFIDGEVVEHLRVNYILRGMEIPAGDHIIEFKFEPQVIKTGSTIALASSVLFGLLALGGLFYEFKNKQKSGA
jgi:hypothetical protein